MTLKHNTSSYGLVANSILLQGLAHHLKNPGKSRLSCCAADQTWLRSTSTGTHLASCSRGLESERAERLCLDSAGEGCGILSGRGLEAATWDRRRPKGHKKSGQECYKLPGGKGYVVPKKFC